jgi:hypothetical protein
MITRVFLLSLVLSSFVSCNKTYSPEIESALQLAGNNRKELVHVLEHYRRSPDDSLKLRAAEFLISNMPGKYSEGYDASWNDVATVKLRWTSSSDKQLVTDTYRIGEKYIRPDVKHITADFLIANIDLAFQSWQDKPWKNQVSFDIFCEEILPYRVGAEPLEHWREKALASFHDLNVYFQQDSTLTTVDACRAVNYLLPAFLMDWDFPPMSYTQLMASHRGNCDRMASLAIFAMRALGIPVSFEFTPLNYNAAAGHSWNAVSDSAGRHISFMGTEVGPGLPHQGNSGITTQVYRATFAEQHSLPSGLSKKALEKISPKHSKNVSLEYNGYQKVAVPVLFAQNDSTTIRYLASPVIRNGRLSDTRITIHLPSIKTCSICRYTTLMMSKSQSIIRLS